MKVTPIRRLQFFFLFALFVLNIIQAFTLPLVDDEAYYWVWSNHLDFGYYDHPPMVALFIKLGYFLFKNELGVRLFSIFSQLLFFIIFLKILNPKTLKENFLFFALFGSVGIFQALGFISTPDVPLLLFGSLFLLCWKNFLETQNFKNALFLAISMALTLYSKYHGVLLIFFVFASAIHKLYKSKWIYFAVFIALILYIPHLYWQYSHNWISLEYHLFERDKKIKSGFFIGQWLLGLLLVSNPLLWFYYGKGLLKKTAGLWQKSLQVMTIGTFLFFGIIAISREVQPQWNIILFLGLIPLTYETFKNQNNKTIIILGYTYIFLLLIVRISLFFPAIIQKTPMYKLKEFVLEAKEENEGTAVFERYQKAALYNFYNQETAVAIPVYTHRYSQYDLWNSEENLQRKTITFFGLENVSEDYITDEDNKNEFYKTVTNFESFPKLKCSISPSELSTDGENTITITWKNPYDKEIILNGNSRQQAGLLVANFKTLEPISISVFNDKITLPAKSSVETSETINLNQFSEGKYKAFIYVKACGISGRAVSTSFVLQIQ